MNDSKDDIQTDLKTISNLSIIPDILEAICKTTHMGFAAVARVTTEKWVACAVRDEIKFGLLPGGELKLDTTICHEIRQTGQEVVIDSVADDHFYSTHHTPAMYGFQSYLSVPLKKQDGSFWGTLCAIDPNPNLLNTPEIIAMFKTYAALISLHMSASEKLSAVVFRKVEARTKEEITKHLQAIFGNDSATVPSDVIQITKGKIINRRSQHFADILTNSSQNIARLINDLKSTYFFSGNDL